MAKKAQEGLEERLKPVVEVLDIEAPEVPRQWSAAFQAFASLLDREIWVRSDAPRIRESLADHLGASGSSIAFGAAEDGIPFTLDGFDDPGYFMPWHGEASRGSQADEAEELLGISDDLSWVRRTVGQVVFVPNPNPSYHLSYSLTSTPGTIYTERCPDPLLLAEVIVHEGMHSAFNLTLDGKPDLKDRVFAAGEFYSPWKDTMRPAFGVLHAVLAFGSVERFYLALDDAGSFDATRSGAHNPTLITRAWPTAEEILRTVDPNRELHTLFSDLRTSLESYGVDFS